MGERIGEQEEAEFAALYMEEEASRVKQKKATGVLKRLLNQTPEEKAKFYQKMDMQALEYGNRKQSKRTTSKEDIAELQRRLVQCCIDFINEKGVGDLEKVEFSADELQCSAEFGQWTPQTDSFIEGYEYTLQEGKNYHYITLKPFVDYC